MNSCLEIGCPYLSECRGDPICTVRHPDMCPLSDGGVIKSVDPGIPIPEDAGALLLYMICEVIGNDIPNE
jgi:hypothetical protein